MSKQAQFKKYQILGVEVDALTRQQAVGHIVSLASDPAKAPVYMVKPYVEFLDRAYREPAFQTLLNQAELSIPDGVALHWAATYLHNGRRNLLRLLTTLSQIVLNPQAIHRLLPLRAAGTKFAWELLAVCADQNLRIFLVGTPNGGRGDIRHTANAIQKRLPRINIIGTYGGYFPPGDEAELVEILKRSKPDLILVGMGFPKQEQLMTRLVKQLPHGVMIGEGGTFDYVSFGGRQPKAPRLLQRLGLEWFWRLLIEPARIKRQLAIPRFIWNVYRESKKSIN
jgi:N-acetylglucosaminyldiphosphoundecaprenol N-acetyl-beta-D-mannosaminyltransferase